MDLVTSMRSIDRAHAWASFGGHGRTNLEAALSGDPDTPAASARLMLPEPGAAQFGRDPRVADLVLEVERTRGDGQALEPLSIPAWHALLVQSLGLASTLAQFLAGELTLNPTNDPAPQLGIWMRAPRTMTDLVDTGTLSEIPGTHISNAFVGYVVADPEGGDAREAASALLTQMCDYTLHLDAYEPLLASLSRGERAAAGRAKGRARA
jgi:hypothetical protein